MFCGHVPGKNILWKINIEYQEDSQENEEELVERKYCIPNLSKSFNDSNGDGIGDIRGIIEKLDYLKELGE